MKTIPFHILYSWGVFDTTLCDTVCQWCGFFLRVPPSKKLTDRVYNVAEKLLKVALNTITIPFPHYIRLKSKRHWQIVHIHIINNLMIIDDCVTSQTIGKVVVIHFNSKTAQSFYFNIIENVWILYWSSCSKKNK